MSKILWLSLAQFMALTPEERKNLGYGIDLTLDDDDRRRPSPVTEHQRDVDEERRDGWACGEAP